MLGFRSLGCMLLAGVIAGAMPAGAGADDSMAGARDVVRIADASRRKLVEPRPTTRRGPWDKKNCSERHSIDAGGNAVYRLCCTFTYSNPHQVVNLCGPAHTVEGRR